ncbi:MAG: ice-binding family protein [Candidatus Saccharimonadaceae bacterium]
MHKTHIKHISIIALVAIFAVTAVTIIISNGRQVHAAQSTVNLRTASPFAILSGTPNITDAGNSSVINGNVGLSPATGAGIGLVCSQVTGTIYSVDATGPLPCRVTNGPLLLTAKNNLTTAYIDAAGRTPLTTVPTELGGTTLVAGVYDSSSTTLGITAGAGALVLDGQNDPSSVFIFQAPFNGTGLVIGSGSTVSLINGAQACNVFWRVDTASIDTTATFVGTILALNSISVANGATIDGRLLARNGDVTLINDTITASICAGNDTADDTPGLPNTGEIQGQYILWTGVLVFFLAGASLLVYAFFKKRSV